MLLPTADLVIPTVHAPISWHQRGNSEKAASEERAARVARHRCLPAANSRQGKQFFPCRIPLKPLHLDSSFEPLFSLSSASLFPHASASLCVFSLAHFCIPLTAPRVRQREPIRLVSEASPSSRLSVTFLLPLVHQCQQQLPTTGYL